VDAFPGAALVLFGHGTTLNPDSSIPVRLHAAELRRRRLFAEVHEAFWKQPPLLQEVLAGISAHRVFLVPLFISEGYFSEQVIPRALGFTETDKGLDRVLHPGAQTWVYCRPVGTHQSMTQVLLARAREVVRQFPFPRGPETRDITLFIAGHGTEQSDNSRMVIEQQAATISAMGIYGGVHAVFMEETPLIGECYQMAQTRNIVVVPFFISDGLHVREDIPVLLGEPERVVQQRLNSSLPAWRNPTEKKGRLVWCAPSVGTDPQMVEVVIERVKESTGWI
jgi:sirohydrochlorin cobaltochelatase